ncbi:MAG: hypothetical protein DRN12_07505 [Thermoplasmata archaeon]|nr:MAG: hypothetical protein DRN12_07505 [Thermoplasmata archaeon]
MIGLDFVKHVDKDWKKHITYADGTPYSDDYCPLSGGKCRQDDCVFWDDGIKTCGYLSNSTRKISIPDRFPGLPQMLIKPR